MAESSCGRPPRTISVLFQVGLRKFAGKSGSGQAKSGGGGGGGGAHEGDSADVPQPGGVIDIWDMLDPVDLLGQLPKSEFNEKIAEAKWNEKVRWRRKLLLRRDYIARNIFVVVDWELSLFLRVKRWRGSRC